MAKERKVIDCSQFPSEKNCTLKISGTEEEILPVAVYHAVTYHGHSETPELKSEIQKLLKNEQ